MRKQGKVAHADIEWLHLLTAEWQLIADLSFADLILWARSDEGEYLAIANARPSTASTMLYRDNIGESAKKQWLPGLNHSHETGEVFFTALEIFDGNKARFEVIPVRRRTSAKSEAAIQEPIAFITRHTALDVTMTPNRISLNYMQAANDILGMVSAGAFPDFNTPTGPKRGAPRASDGLIRLDETGKVTFASPNGLSVINRIGFSGELEGQALIEVIAKALKNTSHVDEGLSLVLTGRAAWRTDVEAGQAVISLRAIPILKQGERTGAIVLVRDVSELRRQERELITKDATIREIHHRVKNNLQTVASLLRIQARRTESAEVRESLDQAMRRVAAIALVHDTLSEGVNQDLDFDAVFDRVLMLTSEVAASHNTTVRTIVDGKFGQLKSEIATPLAVSLTEIVANAVEHGLANRNGVVHVNAERKAKKLDITVTDNGTGLAGGKVGSGLGTQIIRTLIEGELRGSISWLSPDEGGTKVVIGIPL